MRGDRGYRHSFSMHVMLDVHVKGEDLLKEEDAAVLRRCAFSPRPHDPTGIKERARHNGGIAMMLIAMRLSSAVSGSGSELRTAASCITALLSQCWSLCDNQAKMIHDAVVSCEGSRLQHAKGGTWKC